MTAAVKHNGGRCQTNLNLLQTGGEYPFKNVVKCSQEWFYRTAPNVNACVDPSLLDSNGYPTSIQTGGYQGKCYIPLSWVGQSLTMAWDGNGTVSVPGTLTSAVGTDTSSGGSGQLTCTALAQDIYPGAISTAASPNHIRNIRVCLTSEFAAHEAGDIFGTQFKARLVEGNFGVIRFVNWQKGNNTNVTTWATRKSSSYYSYQATEFGASSYHSSYYCGNTTNSGNAYSITGNGLGVPASGSPVHGQIIQVHFNVDATKSGTSSLNLNGAGAKNILGEFSRALSVPDNSYPNANYFSSPTFGTLVFDSDLNAWIKFGADDAGGPIGIDNGVPPELCVQLCAEVGAHPHFIMPMLAADPATDYMTSLAAYCRDNAPSWMVPRFEGCNELWNTLFYQTGYATAKSAILWAGGTFHHWQGKTISVLGQGISTVYSADRTRYQLLCGVQTSQGTDASTRLSSGERLASTAYLGQAAAAQSPYIKSAASNWVTHVCIAQYYTPASYGTQTETDLAAAYTGATTAGKAALAATYADSCNNATQSPQDDFILAKVAGLAAGWKTFAQSFSINKMCGYEGGYSPDYTSNGTSAADILRWAGKNAPNQYGYMIAVLQNFVSLTDSTFTAEFPSNYLLGDQGIGTAGTSGYSLYAWAVFQGDFYSTNTPLWNALVAFNAAQRAPNLRLRIHG